MKLTNANIAILMVALVGISAAFTFAITAQVEDFSAPDPSKGAMMLTGNVKAYHINGDGEVIGIRQSDNHIVGQGMEMIISQVFDQMNSTADRFTRPVSHMEIGHKGEWEILMNDTTLREPANATIATCDRQPATFANVTGPAGLGFGAASIVRGTFAGGHGYCDGPWPNANEVGGVDSADCSAQANVTATGIFAGAICNGPLDIDEAAMWNSPTDGTMFARNNFGGVVLNAPDTLRLDWEFTFTDS